MRIEWQIYYLAKCILWLDDFIPRTRKKCCQVSAHSGFNKCLLILRLLKFQTTQYLVNSTGCLHCIFFVVVVTDPEVSLNISVQRLPRPFTVILYSRRSTRLMQTDSAPGRHKRNCFPTRGHFSGTPFLSLVLFFKQILPINSVFRLLLLKMNVILPPCYEDESSVIIHIKAGFVNKHGKLWGSKKYNSFQTIGSAGLREVSFSLPFYSG